MKVFLESQKAEPTFELNAFDKPLDLSGVEAWTRLIIRLMFQEKGTFPSDPDMGCGISSELYHSIDEIRGKIVSTVEHQVAHYLPDIPLLKINAYSEDELIPEGNEHIIYYMISYQLAADKIVTVKVPSKAVGKIIDFEIKF